MLLPDVDPLVLPEDDVDHVIGVVRFDILALLVPISLRILIVPPVLTFTLFDPSSHIAPLMLVDVPVPPSISVSACI